jgi:Histidine kinase-, DNA gyrase B-, and HSP90-like ATPase
MVTMRRGVAMRLPIEVRHDHLERLARRTDPVGAVEELIWNALDADAENVWVEAESDAMGGVDSVTVRDDGSGITPFVVLVVHGRRSAGQARQVAPSTDITATAASAS